MVPNMQRKCVVDAIAGRVNKTDKMDANLDSEA